MGGIPEGQRFAFSVQNMNGFEEGVEFLPANNTQKVEKGGLRRWVVLVAVLASILTLSLVAGLLVWHFQCEWILLCGLAWGTCCEPEGGPEGAARGVGGEGSAHEQARLWSTPPRVAEGSCDTEGIRGHGSLLLTAPLS